MKWFVPVLVALVLLQSGFEKKGSFDLNKKGSFDITEVTACCGSGGTGEVVIISG